MTPEPKKARVVFFGKGKARVIKEVMEHGIKEIEKNNYALFDFCKKDYDEIMSDIDIFLEVRLTEGDQDAENKN